MKLSTQYYVSSHRTQLLMDRATQHIVLVVIHSFLPLLLYHLLASVGHEHELQINLALIILFCTLDILTLSNLWAMGLTETSDYHLLRIFC